MTDQPEQILHITGQMSDDLTYKVIIHVDTQSDRVIVLDAMEAKRTGLHLVELAAMGQMMEATARVLVDKTDGPGMSLDEVRDFLNDVVFTLLNGRMPPPPPSQNAMSA